jgi:hypothetical protein
MITWLFHRGRGGRGARKLKRLTTEQLQHERLRLDQFLHKSQRDLGGVECAKAELFERGRRAVGPRERENLARQIQRLDTTARHHSRHGQLLNQYLRVVEGLLGVRQNQQLLEEMRVGSAIADVPMTEITRLVEDAVVAGRFESEKFVQVAEALEGALEGADGAADADLKRIVEAMEAAPLPVLGDPAHDAVAMSPALAPATPSPTDEVR